MGGAVSAGENNDELVDNLCYESYIITPEVEEVFRKIDRADYMKFDTEEERIDAYDDRALRKGALHLSAPCIYTKALEALKIERGHSFLNVGSGTGYFSTMVGMLIGPYGVNHGIEIYPENIEFAYMKLKEFKHSCWYDPMRFCDPYFVQGNGLLLSPANRQYDRIYCGAAVPQEHSHLLKNLLNMGGILVMPTEHQVFEVVKLEICLFIAMVTAGGCDTYRVIRMDCYCGDAQCYICTFNHSIIRIT